MSVAWPSRSPEMRSCKPNRCSTHQPRPRPQRARRSRRSRPNETPRSEDARFDVGPQGRSDVKSGIYPLPPRRRSTSSSNSCRRQGKHKNLTACSKTQKSPQLVVQQNTISYSQFLTSRLSPPTTIPSPPKDADLSPRPHLQPQPPRHHKTHPQLPTISGYVTQTCHHPPPNKSRSSPLSPRPRRCPEPRTPFCRHQNPILMSITPK